MGNYENKKTNKTHQNNLDKTLWRSACVPPSLSLSNLLPTHTPVDSSQKLDQPSAVLIDTL